MDLLGKNGIIFSGDQGQGNVILDHNKSAPWSEDDFKTMAPIQNQRIHFHFVLEKIIVHDWLSPSGDEHKKKCDCVWW